MYTITGNHLNLKLIPKDELPYWIANATKGQLAKQVCPPDLVFDYALPQNWLDQFQGDEYYRILGSCVWVYPPRNVEHNSLFGYALNLLNGDMYQ